MLTVIDQFDQPAHITNRDSRVVFDHFFNKQILFTVKIHHYSFYNILSAQRVSDASMRSKNESASLIIFAICHPFIRFLDIS